MQMKFHPDKCHVLHLGRSNPQHNYKMISEKGAAHILETVKSEKDLGVIVDNQLKFSEHIESIARKANRVVGCIARTFKHMNKKSFMLIYKSMIRPHLEYMHHVYGHHT